LTIALFSFYLVADGPKLRRSVCSVLPPRQQKMVVGLWELSIRKTGGYLYSRVLLAALNATFTWFAFLIIGLPSPLALAVFAGIVSQFVPVIGTYIAGALPVLIALLNDPVKALWVIGYLVIYQQVENYLFSPRISARTMEIHPAVAFGSVFVGANLLGAVGAFLALPAAAIVQAFVSSYLHRYELIEEDALAG
jgi:predicted PurR-regulated permease PerM